MVRIPLFVAALVLVLGSATAPACAEDPADHVVVRKHDVTADLLLARHRLEAVDRMQVRAGAAGGTLRLVLAPELKVTRLEVAGTRRRSPKRREDGQFGVRVPAGDTSLTIRYAGKIFDAAKQKGRRVVGEDTRGVIGEMGTFLLPASAWIPEPPRRPPTPYDLHATIDAPHVVVSQGRLKARSTKDGRATAVFESQHPTRGLSLCAGPYVTTSRTVEGVVLSTYFLERNAKAQGLWLDAAGAAARRYAALLGPYPHAKFDIVENFFAASHALPSCALIGDGALWKGTRVAERSDGVPARYLDGMYVSGWFGNGFFADDAATDCCAALATYYAECLAVEQVSKEKAQAFRRDVLERLALRAGSARGRGAMVFHMIRKLVGDATFQQTVRTFAEDRIGTLVSWDDWLTAFDGAAKDDDVSGYIRPWLERRGLPQLELHKVQVRPHRVDDANMTFWIRHTPPDDGKGAWPVRYRLGSVWTYHDVNRGRVTEAHLTERIVKANNLMGGIEMGGLVTAGKPSSITLDPEYDLLRRIPDADLPLCMNRTLGTGGGVVVVKGQQAVFGELAKRLAADHGLRVEGPDFDLAAFSGPALVLEVAADPDAAIEVGGKSYAGAAVAALRSVSVDGRLRTTYLASTPKAAARVATQLPRCGWDTWVVFEGGFPMARRTVRTRSAKTHRRLGD